MGLPAVCSRLGTLHSATAWIESSPKRHTLLPALLTDLFTLGFSGPRE